MGHTLEAWSADENVQMDYAVTGPRPQLLGHAYFRCVWCYGRWAYRRRRHLLVKGTPCVGGGPRQSKCALPIFKIKALGPFAVMHEDREHVPASARSDLSTNPLPDDALATGVLDAVKFLDALAEPARLHLSEPARIPLRHDIAQSEDYCVAPDGTHFLCC